MGRGSRPRTTSVQDKDDIEHAYAAQYTVDKSGAASIAAASLINGELRAALLRRRPLLEQRRRGDGLLVLQDEGRGRRARRERERHVHRSTTRATQPAHDACAATSWSSATSARAARHRRSRSTSGSPRAAAPPPTSTRSAAAPIRHPAPRPRRRGARQDPVPPVSDNDNYCATANQFVVTLAVAFLAEGQQRRHGRARGGTDTKFGVAEFMEGGINMTALGLGNTCFNTF